MIWLNNRKIYRVSIALGTIPFGIGLLIFLCWYLPRRLYAFDWEILEDIGFVGYLVFLFFLLIALGLLMIYWISSRTLLNKYVLFALLFFSFNYLAGNKVVAYGLKVQRMAYLQVKNHTDQMFVFQVLPYFKQVLKSQSTRNGDGKMFIYKPIYDVVDGDRELKLRQAYLKISNGPKIILRKLPDLEAGACKRLLLDDNFDLKDDE